MRELVRALLIVEVGVDGGADGIDVLSGMRGGRDGESKDVGAGAEVGVGTVARAGAGSDAGAGAVGEPDGEWDDEGRIACIFRVGVRSYM